MTRINPRHLLRFYPPSWRARYGDEFLALLEQEGVRPRVVMNVLAGAFDAWISPRTQGTEDRVAAPAAPMGPQIMFCPINRGKRSAADLLSQFYFGAALFVSILGLSVLLHAAWGDTWLGDILQRFAAAFAVGMSSGPFWFREYPKRTQLAASLWMGLTMLGVIRVLTWLWP